MILVEDSNRESLEFSLVHRLAEDIQVGLEFGADSNEYYPVMNYRILDANEEHPALVIGTSSAWPSDEVDGNAVTLTAAQMLGPRISGSLTLAHILEDSSWRVPASLRYGIRPNLEGTLMYDGTQLHPLLTWRRDNFSFSFILLGAEDPTLSVTVGF